MEYLIEQLGRDNRWFILGSRDRSAWAQRDMSDYMRLFPRDAFRVVEHPSRVLIVCRDPNGERFADRPAS
jgi:hypothetical protein